MNKINYYKKMMQQIEQNKKEGLRPSLLLHACCAPCSSACVEALRAYFDLTVFYYNPNITEAAEYQKRCREEQRFLQEFAPEVKFLEGAYVPEAFFNAVHGLEDCPEGGARCGRCFSLRLSYAARLAAEKGFPYYCSTLSVSPHKNAALLNELGEKYAAQYGVIWLHNDFKKQNGYLRSIELAKEHHLYRQNYCGCEFSLRAGEKGALPAESCPKQE